MRRHAWLAMGGVALMATGCLFEANSRLDAPCVEDSACRDGLVCDEVIGLCVEASMVSMGGEGAEELDATASGDDQLA